jgi:lipoyl(octanoyl) transferase
MRWHFLVTPAADGARNMALDEALMRRAARTGDAVFRIYTWSTPTLSLGRNQRARGAYDEAAARASGISFVRRPTGGRALLHDHEITYSVTMPVADAAQAGDAYDVINDVLLDGLNRLGVAARRATDTQSIAPGLRPCFDVPSDREIVVGSPPRKLIGSAQWRRGGGLLQHGSILVRDDQGLIGRLLLEPGTTAQAGTLSEALGREPSAAEVGEVIRVALTARMGAGRVGRIDGADVEADAASLRAAYADPAWTWRR